MNKSEIAKGLRVKAKGYVKSGYFWRVPIDKSPNEWSVVCDPGEQENLSACLLVRNAKSFNGIIVGTSHRVTGLNIHGDNNSRWSGNLINEERHFVVMVQPTHTVKYQKPKAVLLEDLELDLDRDIQDSDEFVLVASSLDPSTRDEMSMMLFDVARSGADEITLPPVYLKFMIGTGLAAMRTTAEMVKIFRTFPVDGDAQTMLDWYNREIKAKLDGLNKIMGE